MCIQKRRIWCWFRIRWKSSKNVYTKNICSGRIFREILRNKVNLTWALIGGLIWALPSISVTCVSNKNPMSMERKLRSDQKWYVMRCKGEVMTRGGQPEAIAQVKYICTKGLKIEEMILNRGWQADARVQVKEPQTKYICIKGLIIPPQVICIIKYMGWGVDVLRALLGRDKGI